MFKNQKPEEKNITAEEKIPWYRRRWFWGVVLGVVFVLVCLCGINILSNIHFNYKLQSIIPLFLFQLPMGLFIIGGLKGIAVFYKLIYTHLLKIYIVVYYIALFVLLFKTLQRKRVKIRYPLILMVIIIISLFGFIVLSGVS